MIDTLDFLYIVSDIYTVICLWSFLIRHLMTKLLYHSYDCNFLFGLHLCI